MNRPKRHGRGRSKDTKSRYQEIYSRFVEFKRSGQRQSDIFERLANLHNRSIGTIHYVCYDKRAKIRMEL